MSTETNSKWTPEDETQLVRIQEQQSELVGQIEELQRQSNNLWLRKEAARKAKCDPLTAYLKAIISSDAKKIESLGKKLSDHATDIRRLLAPFDKQGDLS